MNKAWRNIEAEVFFYENEEVLLHLVNIVLTLLLTVLRIIWEYNLLI